MRAVKLLDFLLRKITAKNNAHIRTFARGKECKIDREKYRDEMGIWQLFLHKQIDSLPFCILNKTLSRSTTTPPIAVKEMREWIQSMGNSVRNIRQIFSFRYMNIWIFLHLWHNICRIFHTLMANAKRKSGNTWMDWTIDIFKWLRKHFNAQMSFFLISLDSLFFAFFSFGLQLIGLLLLIRIIFRLDKQKIGWRLFGNKNMYWSKKWCCQRRKRNEKINCSNRGMRR